jgi:hypothetical protein
MKHLMSQISENSFDSYIFSVFIFLRNTNKENTISTSFILKCVLAFNEKIKAIKVKCLLNERMIIKNDE